MEFWGFLYWDLRQEREIAERGDSLVLLRRRIAEVTVGGRRWKATRFGLGEVRRVEKGVDRLF